MLIDVLKIGLDFDDMQACCTLGFVLNLLQNEITPELYKAIINHIPEAERLIAQARPCCIDYQTTLQGKSNIHLLLCLFAGLGLDTSDVGRFVSLILTFVRFRVGDAAHQAVAEALN